VISNISVVPSNPSVFGNRSLSDLYQEVRELYCRDSNPWVLGFSGGKDSTATLQLIWQALAGLPEPQRTKQVFVLSSDTLVETPVMVEQINKTLSKIDEAAKAQSLPITTHKVTPKLSDTFWVNLIGKGYPAPYNRFRWCTERLKIKPANKFILDCVAEYGEVVVILGVRKSESATRAQAMSLREIEGSILRRHSTLPNAFVFAPIEDFSTDDVWSYLLNVDSPWGSKNQDLLALYRNAQAGECPLVIDTSTPSCGNSRFGCWVCTVVAKDNAMESLIDSGEEWMVPLLDIRDYLSGTQPPENKPEFREHKRRGGKVSTTPEGNISRGPYRFSTRMNILRMLLEAEKLIRKDPKHQEVQLIGPEELQEIRRIWRMEHQDWDDNVPRIFKEVMGHDLVWRSDDGPRFDQSDKQLLEEICETEEIPTALVAKLIDIEHQFTGMRRRAGIYERIERVLNEDWRTEEQVLSELPEGRI